MNPMVTRILIAVGALVVVGGIGYGIWSWLNSGNVTVDYQGTTLQSADICGSTLAYSVFIGVVPFDSELAVDTSTSGDAADRVVCTISGKGDEYLASVDLRCKDMNSPDCISLQKVTGPKDAVLYKRVD